jgi:hypothetical protein
MQFKVRDPITPVVHEGFEYPGIRGVRQWFYLAIQHQYKTSHGSVLCVHRLGLIMVTEAYVETQYRSDRRGKNDQP